MNISARFDRFIVSIRPTRKQREDADQQAAVLKKCLAEYVASDNRFHLQKIFRSGSTGKHTDLMRTGEGTFDIDLGFYYRAEGQTKEELDKLLLYTRTCLRKIYPGKSEKDFHHGKNAINVTFHTSKLRIDVVPIVRDGSSSLKLRNSGKIPREDGWLLTSITAHTHFIHARTARSKLRPGPAKFNHLVRLMKWWNRQLPESLKQRSYFCELITAAALENEGVAETWQGSMERIFAFLNQHAFARPIIFSDYYDATSVSRPKNLVVVLDAVNPKNNIARKWNEDIKRGFLEHVSATYEAIKQAQKAEQKGDQEGALDAWCNVFGDDFRRLSE